MKNKSRVMSSISLWAVCKSVSSVEKRRNQDNLYDLTGKTDLKILVGNNPDNSRSWSWWINSNDDIGTQPWKVKTPIYQSINLITKGISLAISIWEVLNRANGHSNGTSFLLLHLMTLIWWHTKPEFSQPRPSAPRHQSLTLKAQLLRTFLFTLLYILKRTNKKEIIYWQMQRCVFNHLDRYSIPVHLPTQAK